MLNTLISPGYFLINAQLRHIAPNFHNHCPISVILPFITESLRCHVEKNMDNKSYDQLLIVQSEIEANRQDSDEKMKNITKELTAMIASMMDQIKI